MKVLAIVLFTLIPVFAFATTAQPKAPATKEARVCAALQNLADQKCVELMCADGIKQGLYKDENDCTSSDDYAEAAQASCEEILPAYISAYNAHHAGANLTCDQ